METFFVFYCMYAYASIVELNARDVQCCHVMYKYQNGIQSYFICIIGSPFSISSHVTTHVIPPDLWPTIPPRYPCVRVSRDSVLTLTVLGLTVAYHNPCVRVSRDPIVTLTVPGLTVAYPPRYPCVRVYRDSVLTLTVLGLTVAYHNPCVRVSRDSIVTLTVPGLTVAYHPPR